MAGITVLPADGQTRGLQVRAQTVDAIIREEAGIVWADTRLWINFYNAGRTPLVVPVVLPGPQLAPAPLPEQIKATLDDQPLILTLLPASDDQPQVRMTAVVTAPVRGTAALRISYRQELPLQDGQATFSYFLAAAAQWSGKPESLRVTVRFDPRAAPGQFLGFAPAISRRERDGLTWHWENTEVTDNIGVTFIPASWWADLDAARRQATPEAGLQEHGALAERYWRLATLPPPFFQSQGYFERFFPAAVGALAAGLAAPKPAAAPAEIAAAHVRLADFYQGRAERLAPEAALPSLQLAASELQAALALQPAAPTRQAAGALYRRLLALARDREDALAVQEHEARLAAIATATGLPSDRALALNAALTRAEQAVERGDAAAAAQEVAAAFGAAAVARPDMPAPRIAQTRVSVTTTPTRRDFSVQAYGDDAASAALLAQAGQALARVTQVEIRADRLTFSLPSTDAQQLRVTQATAAAALADLPELALLAAALAPAEQAWSIDHDPFRISEAYVELVDLRPARTAWEARAAQLAAAAEAARQAEGATPEARLARVQAALWANDAAAWRALAERSSIVYRAELETREVIRAWEMTAGEAREIEAHVQSWRYARLAGAAGTIALLLVLMIYAVWRAAR